MATEFRVSMSDRNVFRAIYPIIAQLAGPRTRSHSRSVDFDAMNDCLRQGGPTDILDFS